MTDFPLLPIEAILAAEAVPVEGLEIGRSREDRPLFGHRLGSGPLAVSLIAGCHADEPVGPAMLDRLAAFLASLGAGHPALTAATWILVPHANPDGDARNRAWTGSTRPVADHQGQADEGYDLAAYLRHVVRELPGDDMEFGFPRSTEDGDARPENRSIAEFLAPAAPFSLHGSFHGMAFAPGPWFLIEASWATRTAAMRRALRRQVALMGYRVFDVDRQGEKGFFRIDEGFTSRPDSRAMAMHFRNRGEDATADLFRPSSMEYARRLSGDCFTFVSEMPLFLRPPLTTTEDDGTPSNIGSANRRRFHTWLGELVADRDADAGDAEAARHGIRPMPIRDQMRLQLGLLNETLDAVRRSLSGTLVGLLVLLLALLAGACAPTDESRGGSDRLSLLLITLDTTRADHLQPYGATGVATPHLAALADSGAVFEHAYAVTPITLPSHATLLTGLGPRRHGVHSNEIHRLPATIPTLAESLRSAGYRTAAFVSATVLERRYGLDRGFEAYDDDLTAAASVDRPAGASPAEPSAAHQPVAERPAEVTVAAAIAWLDSLPAGEPFFLWVHLYDPHAAYRPPSPYDARYADNPYDGEIAYMDAEIGRLLDHPRLQAVGDGPPPAIMAIADHGESLGEHDEETHGILVYDSTLHIPWIARIPGAPAGLRIAEPVSQIDFVPTVRELLAIDGPPSESPLPGRSLVGLLRGDPGGAERSLYAESYSAFYLYGWSKLHALRRGGTKYIAAPAAELYDTATDPRELTNRLAEEAAVGADLAAQLDELLSEPEATTAVQPTADAETRARLRALGYLSSGIERRDDEAGAERRDPKAMMAVHNAVSRAERLLTERRAEESLDELDGILALDPDNGIAWRYKGQALWDLGRLEEAATAFDRSLEAAPDNPLVLLLQGLLEGAQGRTENALERVDQALSIDPDLLEARLEKARFMDTLGHRREAIQILDEALITAPHDPWVNFRYAQIVELPQGETAAAIRRLQALTASRPQMAEAWWLLAEALERAAQPAAALAAVREGLTRVPGEPRLTARLGPATAAVESDRALTLYRQGRHREAVAAWQSLAERFPDFAPVHSDLAAAALAAGDPDRAESEARQALDIDPTLAAAWTNLGEAQIAQQRLEQAVTSFRTAQRIDPADAPTALRLGGLLASMRRYEEAATTYRQVLAQVPDQSEAHYELGLLLSGPLGDAAAGRHHLERALALQPNHPRADVARQLLDP